MKILPHREKQIENLSVMALHDRLNSYSTRASSIAIIIGLIGNSGADETSIKYRIENVEAVDGSIQQSLVFETVKGVGHTIEASNDLHTWEAEEDVGEFELSSEQTNIASSNRTNQTADINAYIIGGCKTIQPWEIENDQLKPQFSLNGIAHQDSIKVWINGTARDLTGEALEAALKERLNVLAHEMGHVMIGPGHPGPGNGGPVPLPMTVHSDRLMWIPWPGESSVGARRTLLVKGEWDKIEGWAVGRGK